jgi:hypothetical protein
MASNKTLAIVFIIGLYLPVRLDNKGLSFLLPLNYEGERRALNAPDREKLAT